MATAWTQGFVNVGPQVTNVSQQMTTKPKLVNGQVVGYYHIYPDRTVFVPLKAASAGGGAAAGGAAGGAEAPDPMAAARAEAQRVFEQRRGAIYKTRDDALLDLTATEGRTRREYGIDDKSDPFSKAALLQESLQRAQKVTNTSMAARGQLYAGALQNSQNENSKSYLQQNDALAKAYQAALSSISQRRRDITNTAEQQVGDANSTALDQLLQTRPDVDQVDPGNLEVTPNTGGDAPGGASSGFKFVQTAGSRKGLSYNIIMRGNVKYRKYENGDLVKVA